MQLNRWDPFGEVPFFILKAVEHKEIQDTIETKH